MSLIENLRGILGRAPNTSDLAGHFADSISALEQNKNNFRLDGDINGIDACNRRIKELRGQALTSGLDRDKYPGLYR